MTGLLPAMTARWRGVYPSSSFLNSKKKLILAFLSPAHSSWARIIRYHWSCNIIHDTCWGVRAVLKGSSQRRQASPDLKREVFKLTNLRGSLTHLRGRGGARRGGRLCCPGLQPAESCWVILARWIKSILGPFLWMVLQDVLYRGWLYFLLWWGCVRNTVLPHKESP